MALSSLLLSLIKKYRQRYQDWRNMTAVAHLTDEQLKDIGLWRMDGKVGSDLDRTNDLPPPRSIIVEAMAKLIREKAYNASPSNVSDEAKVKAK